MGWFQWSTSSTIAQPRLLSAQSSALVNLSVSNFAHIRGQGKDGKESRSLARRQQPTGCRRKHDLSRLPSLAQIRSSSRTHYQLTHSSHDTKRLDCVTPAQSIGCSASVADAGFQLQSRQPRHHHKVASSARATYRTVQISKFALYTHKSSTRNHFPTQSSHVDTVHRTHCL
jgi:hypothetical protein